MDYYEPYDDTPPYDDAPPTFDLYGEVRFLREKVNEDIRRMREDGMRVAQANRDYQVAKYVKIEQMRAEKVPSTVISMEIHGIEPVVSRKYELDVAEVEYKASQEVVLADKKSLGIVDAQLGREWANPQAGF